MTEKEKMLAGELYDAGDPALREERRRAHHLTHLYNQTTEEEGERRVELLRELLGAVGPDIAIEPPFHCDYGINISVGARFYMNMGGVILDCNRVTIGDDVLCGPYVQIYAAYHPTDSAVRRLGPELAAPVTIGNDVWIGGGAIICPGVTIGDGSTIGAGSVVVRDIPARVFAAGNPCRVIRALDEA